MNQLLEDYKRRLKTADEEYNKLLSGGREEDIDTCKRLMTKMSCYRTFIAELEREIQNKA